MKSLEDISKYVDKILPEIKELSKLLHQHAELSEHEYETSKIIQTFLSEEHIPYRKDVAGQGVIGYVKGQNDSRAIGIRADIDALPIHEQTELAYQSIHTGVMHACGHDVHTAILLGTGKVLQNFREWLPYSVSLFFQPAEETIGGAYRMIEAGCLKNPKVNVTIGLHVDPSLPVGNISFTEGVMNAASSEFEIHLKGLAAHGAHPHLGKDTIIPACQITSSLPAIIKSKTDPTHPVLVSIGKIHGGVKNNIIADETTISGIIRTFSNSEREKVINIIKQTCSHYEKLYDIQVRANFDYGYPALINDDRLLKCMIESTSQIIDPENIVIDNNPTFGTDDFAFFGSDGRQALYYNLGVGSKDETFNHPIHNEYFVADLDAIRYGILSEVWGILSLMENNII